MMVWCLVTVRSWVCECVNRELSESRDGRFYDAGLFQIQTRQDIHPLPCLALHSTCLFLFTRRRSVFTRSVCVQALLF